MIKLVRNAAARLMRGVAQRLDPIVQKRAAPPLQRTLDLLRTLSFKPAHIVDIGANHGDWTRITKRYFPDSVYTLIEPQPQLRERIQDLLSDGSKVTLHSVGVGAQDGEMAFTIHQEDHSSTFSLSAEEAQKLGLKQIMLPVRSLDSLLAENGLPPPDLIKIDAEGLDLQVLQGAALALRTCEVVYVECGIMCHTVPNDVLTVIQTMQNLGFSLFDLSDGVRTEKHGCLWLLELVFVKTDGALARQVVFQ